MILNNFDRIWLAAQKSDWTWPLISKIWGRSFHRNVKFSSIQFGAIHTNFTHTEWFYWNETELCKWCISLKSVSPIKHSGGIIW